MAKCGFVFICCVGHFMYSLKFTYLSFISGKLCWTSLWFPPFCFLSSLSQNSCYLNTELLGPVFSSCFIFLSNFLSLWLFVLLFGRFTTEFFHFYYHGFNFQESNFGLWLFLFHFVLFSFLGYIIFSYLCKEIIYTCISFSSLCIFLFPHTMLFVACFAVCHPQY